MVLLANCHTKVRTLRRYTMLTTVLRTYMYLLHTMGAYQEGDSRCKQTLPTVRVTNTVILDLNPKTLTNEHGCGSISMVDCRCTTFSTSFWVYSYLSAPPGRSYWFHWPSSVSQVTPQSPNTQVRSNVCTGVRVFCVGFIHCVFKMRGCNW